MKSDFMRAINQLCAERGLPQQVVLEAVEQALVSAYKRDLGSAANVKARLDPDSGEVRIFTEKQVVEEVEDEYSQISLAQAKESFGDVALGESVLVETTPANFGRIAAQTAKQVILQRIREAERDVLYEAFAEQEGEMVNGTVQSISPQAITLSLGRAEAILPRGEQVPGERYRPRQRLRVYVLSVTKTSRGPEIVVSRTHWAMLRRLLELEVPEIYNGTVEIKAIAREPGSRSKVAVAAVQQGIDPVGACVGMRGVRIQSIVNELGGEKIDVVEWNPDPRRFIANALSPARPLGVELIDEGREERTAMVVVPDKQLSLAIGKEGQNARLAAKLTGWRIDILNPEEAAERTARLAAQEAVRLAEALVRGELKPGEIDQETPIQVLSLNKRLLSALEEAEVTKVGHLLERLERGDLLSLRGVGPKSIEEIEERLRMAGLYGLEEEEVLAEAVVEEAPSTKVVPELEVALEEAAPPEVAVEKPMVEEMEAEVIALPEKEVVKAPEREKPKEPEEGLAVYVGPGGKKKKRKGDLIYDEKLGEMVARKRRKPSRRQEDWRREIELWEEEGHDSDEAT